MKRFPVPPAVLLDALSRCPALSPDHDWLRLWRRADVRVGNLATTHLDDAPWFEGRLIRALLARLPDGDAVLCANSLPIRQLDTWTGAHKRAQGVRIFGNRGASGIDGQTSTLAGLNHGGGPCWGLFGDLSLFHDLGGLLLAPRLTRPVLVVNNGGGRIFDYLPQLRLPGIETLWRTPVDLDLGSVATTFGLDHRLVVDDNSLCQALDQAIAIGGARMLIEVRIDADASRAIHVDYWRRVAATRIWDDPSNANRA